MNASFTAKDSAANGELQQQEIETPMHREIQNLPRTPLPNLLKIIPFWNVAAHFSLSRVCQILSHSSFSGVGIVHRA
ncbi:conserved hypothetical protein [Ricinus communis]|uniref:Uncharacterized protein n=1 Tax=Ricinus communis TaxID=3988 RepID=B9SG44_RICCO|nr:conserved hypothetical protein [Ricinus communis]